MDSAAPSDIRPDLLLGVGLEDSEVEVWAQTEPTEIRGYAEDVRRYSEFWARSDRVLHHLPKKQVRSPQQHVAALHILESARKVRERFLRAYVELLYNRLTDGCTTFLRIDRLVRDAAYAVPGLVPSRERIATNRGVLLRDKEEVEIDQGLFVSHVLANERAGTHLLHAMLLPRPEALELVPKFASDNAVDLGPARVERRGRAVHVTLANPRYLNAEDESTLEETEIAVDLAILDTASEVAVLRGGTVEHPKYRGRRVLGAGINLTHLYHGRIPYLWFMQRDLGYLNKIYRGIARPNIVPDDMRGTGKEKPWIGVVETFAVGGHCQALLVMDHVLGAEDAYMALPARREGIIPGFANLRLPRFVGDGLARQLIQQDQRLDCASAEGRLICDEVAPAAHMDAAIETAVESLLRVGPASAIGNRRVFRAAREPLVQFRRYASAYAREQAYCLFSKALLDNLDAWHAKSGRA